MKNIKSETQERIMSVVSYGGGGGTTFTGKDFNNYGYETPAPPGPFSSGGSGDSGSDWADNIDAEFGIEAGTSGVNAHANVSGSLSSFGDAWDSFTDSVSDSWDSFTDTVGGWF